MAKVLDRAPPKKRGPIAAVKGLWRGACGIARFFFISIPGVVHRITFPDWPKAAFLTFSSALLGAVGYFMWSIATIISARFPVLIQGETFVEALAIDALLSGLLWALLMMALALIMTWVRVFRRRN